MFDFLKDNNEQAAHDRIRARLKADPDAFLADCKSRCASACASSLAEQIRSIDDAVVKRLSALSRFARRCVDDFPMPRGVFVTAEDRKQAYLHMMDALPTLHRQTREVQRVTTEFLRLDRIATTRRQASLAAEQQLGIALLALRNDHALALPYTALSESLKQENENASLLSALAGKQTDLLIGFYKTTVTAFFARAEKVADLQNQGRAADPAGTATLFDRLAREADLLADEILLTQQRIRELS